MQWTIVKPCWREFVAGHIAEDVRAANGLCFARASQSKAGTSVVPLRQTATAVRL